MFVQLEDFLLDVQGIEGRNDVQYTSCDVKIRSDPCFRHDETHIR